VPRDVKHLESLQGRLEVRIVPRTAEAVALKLYSTQSLPLTQILRTLQNLGLAVTEEMRIPLVLPDGRKAVLYRFEVEAAPEVIAAVRSDGSRVRSDAKPARPG
jgi:NAD-specific glutamate dehydrogenase